MCPKVCLGRGRGLFYDVCMALSLGVYGCGDEVVGSSLLQQRDAIVDMAGTEADEEAGGATLMNAGENGGMGTGESSDEVAGENAGEVAGESAGEGIGESAGEGIGENAGEVAGENAGEAAGEETIVEPDSDGDGIPDAIDDFPNNPEEFRDTDGDGIGDAADLDDDNDGLSDEEELSYGEDCRLSDFLRVDTDHDGINDDQDPYPRDPFPEFMLRAREDGLIDLFLSNRDGSFREAIVIGDPILYNNQSLSYRSFSIGDFDGDGIMDFIAHSTPFNEATGERYIYLFKRSIKADEFVRFDLGITLHDLYGITADVNGDHRFDIVRRKMVRPSGSMITSGEIQVYLNNGFPISDCASSPNVEDQCFFTTLPRKNLNRTVNGQWTARVAAQAVNLNPNADQFVDLTMATYASGGNAATRVYTLNGDGQGGFADPVQSFVHNQMGEQSPVNTMLFADFDRDGVGDILIGFDDDGRAGEAWTYLGLGDGSFDTQPISAVDINPDNAVEDSGGQTLGREASGRTFDFDFDGMMDLMIGVRTQNYRSPGETRLYRGLGNGTFDAEYSVIGDVSEAYAQFAIPAPLCARFSY